MTGKQWRVHVGALLVLHSVYLPACLPASIPTHPVHHSSTPPVCLPAPPRDIHEGARCTVCQPASHASTKTIVYTLSTLADNDACPCVDCCSWPRRTCEGIPCLAASSAFRLLAAAWQQQEHRQQQLKVLFAYMAPAVARHHKALLSAAG
jgi:hypothetical protein